MLTNNRGAQRKRENEKGRKMTNRFLFAFCLFAFALASGCRYDMQDQPRFKPLAKSDFYSDLRSARPPVEGTVARGQLHEDTYFYTGKVGNNPGDYMPFPVTDDVLARGRERFNIYCSPCHGQTGSGDGMVTLRGFRRPPSYHIDRLRAEPLQLRQQLSCARCRKPATRCQQEMTHSMAIN